VQTLASSPEEFYFGGGMINGQFSHKGTKITISTSNDWGDGGNPNSAPFYSSTAGYSLFRNTWAPGNYDFTSSESVAIVHNATEFDAFYFAGSFAAGLDGYTSVTGRPFMVPVYGLGLGDSDCYHNHRHGNSTRTVLAIADQYRERSFPGAWFLTNDGYGCGYGEGPASFPTNFTDLDYVVAELHKRGFYSGLWSSTGLPNIAREVKGSGVRIGKTDVGWIGSGYEYAFDSVKLVSDGIEDNSDGRRFIWTVDGWAGTQRYAVMWTGDDSGSWDFIRWQIPTFVGAGFSAQAHVSGDVDGIFGGSPDTYVRDLQFKCLMTTMMTMSGWAGNPDKQPWTYGEPYASINRMYLKIKSRLTPYFYTYSRIAHETGMPPVRAMALQFPEDNSTWTNHTGTAYQFMSGDWLLVAPIYEDAVTRDGIYLPAGTWIDYWNGTEYTGPATLDGYAAPLDKLPIFIRAGAILPLWPDMLFFDEKPHDPITLQVYPGDNESTSFSMYEDDGVTRQHEAGTFAKTLITVDAPPKKDQKQPLNITIGAANGGFVGQRTERVYYIDVHLARPPKEVSLDGKPLQQMYSVPSVQYAESGWYFDSIEKQGVLHIKLPNTSVTADKVITLSNGKIYPHICLVACGGANGPAQGFVGPPTATSGQIVHTGGAGMCLTASDDPDVDSHTPAVELQPCSKTNGNQQWTYNADKTLSLTNSPKHCMDQDGTDHHVEMYGCGKAQANQQWTMATVDDVSVIKQANGQQACMTPCSGELDIYDSHRTLAPAFQAKYNR
jgi:hypothetical protein